MPIIPGRPGPAVPPGTLATDAELAAHAADTTAIHGITDTAQLVTTTVANATYGVDAGAANGVDDTVALNAVLAANAGRTVILRAWNSYKISGPLVMKSGTTVVAFGATVTLLANSLSNMIQNEHIGTASRDTDLKVIGGTWDRGALNAETSPSTGTAGSKAWAHSFVFDGVDGLEVGHLTMAATSGKYAISPGDVTDYWIHDIEFDTGSDGVHVIGPASGGVIERLSGSTGDDYVAISSNEGTGYSAYGYTSGPIKGLTIRDLHANPDGNFVNIFGTTHLVSDVLVERISGTTAGPSGVRLGVGDVASSNVARITIRDVAVSGATVAAVVVTAETSDDIVMENIHNLNTSGSTTAVLLNSAACGDVRITDARVDNSQPAVAVTDGDYKTITVKDCTDRRNANTGIVSAYTTTVEPTIDTLALVNCHRDATGYTGYLLSTGQAVQRLKLTGCTGRRTNKALVVGAKTANSLRVYMVGCELEGNGWANFAGPGAVTLNGHGNTLGSGVTVSGAPTVTAFSFNIAMDAINLAPTANCMAYNTNAARSCGVGPIVANGTLWKHLYTGATY